jgi:IclR family acetate operon transcriptional repressor
LHILEAVEPSARGKGLAELCAELGMDKATALRTLETLVAERVLTKAAGSGLYSPNLASWAYLVQSVSPALSLISSVQRVLDNTAEATAATSLVVLPTLGGRTVRAPMYSLAQTKMFYDRSRAPEDSLLHAAAAGKCLLASWTKDELTRYLQVPLTSTTDRTITSRRALERESARVRRQGYALNQGETVSGSSGIAVPLRKPGGAVVGGLSLGFVGEGVAQQEATNSLPALQESAEQISGLMSYTSWLDCLPKADGLSPQVRSPWDAKDLAFADPTASQVRTVARTTRLTAHLIRHPQGVSLGQLADERGLGKATTWRLLRSLSSCGVVCQDAPDQSYRIDPLFWIRRAPVLRSAASLTRATEGILQEVANATGANAALGVPDREERYGLAYCPVLAPGPIRWRAEYAPLAPLHTTASGKCYLAAQSKLSVNRYMNGGLEAMTEASIVSREGLLQELARVRQQGYALSREEMSPGIGVLAVPVTDADGTVVGGVAILTVMPMLSEDRIRQFLPLLRQAAGRLSRVLVADWHEHLERERSATPAGQTTKRVTEQNGVSHG